MIRVAKHVRFRGVSGRKKWDGSSLQTTAGRGPYISGCSIEDSMRHVHQRISHPSPATGPHVSLVELFGTIQRALRRPAWRYESVGRPAVVPLCAGKRKGFSTRRLSVNCRKQLWTEALWVLWMYTLGQHIEVMSSSCQAGEDGEMHEVSSYGG